MSISEMNIQPERLDFNVIGNVLKQVGEHGLEAEVLRQAFINVYYQGKQNETLDIPTALFHARNDWDV